MSIFKYFDNLDSGKFLLIESNRLLETIKYIKKEKIENLYISRFHGYNLDTIEPLFELKGIKKIEYQEFGEIISMAGIEYFKDLEHLRIDDEQKVDLSAFPKLKFLNIKWSKKILNFDLCNNLEELILWNFNTKEKDFSNFPYLKNLKILKLFRGNATSLEKIKISKKINKIEFHIYPKLVDISKLVEFDSIEYLYLENCKRIKGFKNLSLLSNLKTFAFNTCGELESIDFVKYMAKLEDVRFVGTNIKNGDLSLLANDRFKYIGFDNKRHYTHKYEELKPIKNNKG